MESIFKITRFQIPVEYRGYDLIGVENIDKTRVLVRKVKE